MSLLGMRTEHPEQLGEQALPHMLSFRSTGEIATEKASFGTWLYYLRGGLTGESNWFSYSLQCAQCSFLFSPVMSWNFPSGLLCSHKTLSSMGVSLNQRFPGAPNSSQDRLELVHGSLQAPELEPHCWGYTWKNWKPRFKHIPVHQCS